MVKAGDEYQEIVGDVQRALDPGATVKVGTWVIGPDGKRDLDVEVRGTVEGRPRFILIECKDWRRRVGIDVVDALKSKREDLGADQAIIYSNSGFTKPALHKADRIGIDALSALRASDGRIRIQINGVLYAKRLSVEKWSLATFFPEDSSPIGKELVVSDLRLNGLPVQDFLAVLSRKFLMEQEPDGRGVIFYSLRPCSGWTYRDKHIDVSAIAVQLWCSRKWLSQVVRQDVSQGYYDHIRKCVLIPDKQMYWLGPIDQNAWRPCNAPDMTKELTAGRLVLRFTYVHAIHHISAISGHEAKGLEDLVVKRKWLPQ